MQTPFKLKISDILNDRPTVEMLPAHRDVQVSISSTLRAHFLPMFWRKKIAKPNIIRENLLNLLLYEKHANKMLMKLTPGVNFINILQSTFGPIFLCQKDLKSHNVSIEKLREALLYKKIEH
jgi:hypothetical protein